MTKRQPIRADLASSVAGGLSPRRPRPIFVLRHQRNKFQLVAFLTDPFRHSKTKSLSDLFRGLRFATSIAIPVVGPDGAGTKNILSNITQDEPAILGEIPQQ